MADVGEEDSFGGVELGERLCPATLHFKGFRLGQQGADVARDRQQEVAIALVKRQPRAEAHHETPRRLEAPGRLYANAGEACDRFGPGAATERLREFDQFGAPQRLAVHEAGAQPPLGGADSDGRASRRSVVGSLDEEARGILRTGGDHLRRGSQHLAPVTVRGYGGELPQDILPTLAQDAIGGFKGGDEHAFRAAPFGEHRTVGEDEVALLQIAAPIVANSWSTKVEAWPVSITARNIGPIRSQISGKVSALPRPSARGCLAARHGSESRLIKAVSLTGDGDLWLCQMRPKLVTRAADWAISCQRSFGDLLQNRKARAWGLFINGR